VRLTNGIEFKLVSFEYTYTQTRNFKFGHIISSDIILMILMNLNRFLGFLSEVRLIPGVD